MVHTWDSTVRADIGVGLILDIVEPEGFNHVGDLEFLKNQDNLDFNQMKSAKPPRRSLFSMHRAVDQRSYLPRIGARSCENELISITAHAADMQLGLRVSQTVIGLVLSLVIMPIGVEG